MSESTFDYWLVPLDDRDQLPEECARLVENGHVFHGAFAEDVRETDGCFRVHYLFGHPNGDQDVSTVTARIPPESASFPNVTSVVPAADWWEREMVADFGLTPTDHPSPTPLYPVATPSMPPMRTDVDPDSIEWLPRERPEPPVTGSGTFELPFGPIRSGVTESIGFRFHDAGEHIVRLDVDPFYKRRGMEKLIEGKPLDHAVVLAERISVTSGVAHSLAFCQAVESALDFDVPTRTRQLRVVFAELERLYNHIDVIEALAGSSALSLGNAQMAILKEDVRRLNARLTGHRYLLGVNTVGGVRVDLDDEAIADARETVRAVSDRFEELVDRMRRTPTHMDRLDGTGELRREQAETYGATGPVARASGVDRDARRDHPYAAYDDLEFSVHTEPDGDAHARMNVRVAEALTSATLVEDVLSDLSPEPARGIESRWIAPHESTGVSLVETPKGTAFHWVRFDADGALARAAIGSPSFRNWYVYPLTMDNNILTDVAFIADSFGLSVSGGDR